MTRAPMPFKTLRLPRSALMIAGCMRSGKTTLLQHHIEALAAKNFRVLVLGSEAETLCFEGNPMVTILRLGQQRTIKASDYNCIVLAASSVYCAENQIAPYEKIGQPIIDLFDKLIEKQEAGEDIPFVIFTTFMGNSIDHPLMELRA